MKLLVGVDLYEATENVVKKVEEIAKALSAKVWILYIAEPEPAFVGYKAGPESVREAKSEKFHREHRQIQEIADRLRSEGIETTALLVQGQTIETILNQSHKLDVDMIVLGSHEKGLIHQLIEGSVSEGVLHKSKCSILIIPI